MEFHVTEAMAADMVDRLASAGAALGIAATFTEVTDYSPGSREDLAAYMADHGVEFFSVAEVVEPHKVDKAREAGFEELVPPLHLWPWAMLVLRLGDEMRGLVGRPVTLRNLYRPMSYNRLVAKSGITSDHPNACAGDFDFRSQDDRRTAEALVRQRAAEIPDLEVSLGMGARSLHLGVLSPKGTRHWFYDSYEDPRVPLSSTSDEDVFAAEGAAADGSGGFGAEEPTVGGDEEFGEDQGTTGEDGPIAGEEDVSADKQELAAFPRERVAALDEEIPMRIIEQTALHESDGDFSAMNRDGEFRGLFNRNTENHPAFERFHIGLSYGLVQFTQDSGSLGKLLEEMERRDPDSFHDIFGEHADDLIELTTARGPSSSKTPPRGPRVQPLEGADLWEEPWISRFREAGENRGFQDAQLSLASQLYLEPMLRFCHWLGLNTDRALGIVFDRSIQQGRGGARRWIMNTVGPIDPGDQEMIDFALHAYGFSDLREFQRSIDGLGADGKWGPNTHAALCFFERQRDDSEAFVMHVPDRKTMLDMMVVASADRRWGHRVKRLRETDAFDDVELDLVSR